MTRTRLLRALALVAVTLLVMAAFAAFAFFWVRAQRSRAELVIHGRIITFEQAMPEARALAARGGRIIAIGDDDAVEEHVGWWTRVIELEDGVVATRGFIEGPGDFLALADGQPPLAALESQGRLATADRAASARGITSFRDTAATLTDVEQMKRMIDSGTLKTRLWVAPRPGDVTAASDVERAAIRGYGDHRLSVRVDGGDPGPDQELVGSLAPGKLADITVVRGTTIVYTIVGGEVVYEADAR
jgi:predicted amidohydrolase YtcJ